jgi:HSP20 family molecular chaperone IbpA
MQRFLDHVSRQRHFEGALAPDAWAPLVDVYEGDAGVIVVLDLAGIDPGSVDIDVTGRVLRISGTRLSPSPSTCRRLHRLEIPSGRFERAIELPSPVDVGSSTADYRDGFLHVSLPHVRPSRLNVTVRNASATEQGIR